MKNFNKIFIKLYWNKPATFKGSNLEYILYSDSSKPLFNKPCIDKPCIELSYEGHENDISVQLVKKVLKEAIKLGDKEVYSKYPRQGWCKVKDFIEENFSLND